VYRLATKRSEKNKPPKLLHEFKKGRPKSRIFSIYGEEAVCPPGKFMRGAFGFIITGAIKL